MLPTLQLSEEVEKLEGDCSLSQTMEKDLDLLNGNHQWLPRQP